MSVGSQSMAWRVAPCASRKCRNVRAHSAYPSFIIPADTYSFRVNAGNPGPKHLGFLSNLSLRESEIVGAVSGSRGPVRKSQTMLSKTYPTARRASLNPSWVTGHGSGTSALPRPHSRHPRFHVSAIFLVFCTEHFSQRGLFIQSHE